MDWSQILARKIRKGRITHLKRLESQIVSIVIFLHPASLSSIYSPVAEKSRKSPSLSSREIHGIGDV
jgi:hypothetical protein